MRRSFPLWLCWVLLACGEAPLPAHPRVALVGIDGAEWSVIDPMLARGELPNLQRLIARGVRGPLQSFKPTLSPALWTSVATGVRPSQHGVTNFVTRAADATIRQVESGDRRVPALWNIASAEGRTVGVVGWWATWPAESVQGTLVSDFLLFAASARSQSGNVDPLWPRAAWPRQHLDALANLLPGDWQLTPAELAQFVPRDSPRFAAHAAAPARVESLRDPPLVVLKDNYRISRFYWQATQQLLDSGQPDLLLHYTNFVDAVEHKFWRYYEPEAFGDVSAAERADFGATIPRAYAFFDRELGDLLDRLHEDTYILVISDHGHHATQGGGKVFSGGHRDAPDGVFVAAGPGITGPRKLETATLLDIAPTVLALLEIPAAKTMPGRVLPELVPRDRIPARVASYDNALADPIREVPAPELPSNVRERLRALGYLEEEAN